MKILYISSFCSKKVYSEITKTEKRMYGQQQQKFGYLLVSGFKKNFENISCLTKLPLSKSMQKETILKINDDMENQVKFHYLSSIKLPIIRNVISFIQTFCFINRFICKDKGDCIICDPMLTIPFFAALLSTKIFKKKLLAILTDLPNNYVGFLGKKQPLSLRISSLIMKNADFYVFLTEKMNEVVNKRGKPYIVMEGMVDFDLKEIKPTSKYIKKVCMYTGGIVEIYGLGMFIKAFIEARITDSELHIYGNGTYAEKLQDIIKQNEEIKYFGTKINSFIVEEQMKATLLINPRLTNYEYTSYSFPSKNMEYMASGTPVLTTLLPGMPTEYIKQVYLFEEETVEGMKNKLIEILQKPREELENKGLHTKKWILENKNNQIQVKRIIDLILQNDIDKKNEEYCDQKNIIK